MKNPSRIFRIATIIILAYMICWCAAMVLLPLRPFWRDEWCLIYNLKFKSSAMLWGHLDFTQQFPRVYLQLIKVFTSWLHYSYFSLRFPSFLTGTLAVFLSYHLMNRLFPDGSVKYLFVLIIAAHPVFIDYFVQIKHYEMEILLSLAALWQLLELLGLGESRQIFNSRYLLLCTSFLVVPFFSYTYPIAIAPVFVVMFFRSMFLYNSTNNATGFKKYMLYQWVPLLICMASILVFYIIDVSQLMADKNMYGFWGFSLVQRETGWRLITSWTSIIGKIWLLFAKAGAGYAFEIIFGILGIISFWYTVRYSIKDLKAKNNDTGIWVRLYSVTLIALVIFLYLIGKLPLGEAKFSAFTVPSIAIIIVFLITQLLRAPATKRLAAGLNIILFIALTGNILIAFINRFIIDEYKKELSIYLATEKAIDLAYKNKIPILVTPAIGFPDDLSVISPFLSMPSAAGILKTFPAYRADDTIAIYAVKDLTKVNDYKRLLPASITTVLAGDGLSYTLLRW